MGTRFRTDFDMTRRTQITKIGLPGLEEDPIVQKITQVPENKRPPCANAYFKVNARSSFDGAAIMPVTLPCFRHTLQQFCICDLADREGHT